MITLSLIYKKDMRMRRTRTKIEDDGKIKRFVYVFNTNEHSLWA